MMQKIVGHFAPQNWTNIFRSAHIMNVNTKTKVFALSVHRVLYLHVPRLIWTPKIWINLKLLSLNLIWINLILLSLNHILVYMIKGCEFHGRKEEVKDHLEKCGYRGLPKTISHRDFQDQVCVSILYRYMHMCCVFMDLYIFKFNSFCSVWVFFQFFLCFAHSFAHLIQTKNIKQAIHQSQQSFM